MTSPTQRKATAAHRRRNRARGLVRVEIQVPRADAALLRDLGERLRASDIRAKVARDSLNAALAEPEPEAKSVLDMFASDLPDEYFDGVFDRVRTISKREIDL